MNRKTRGMRQKCVQYTCPACSRTYEDGNYVFLTNTQRLYLSLLIDELTQLRAGVYTRQGDFNDIKNNIEIEGLLEIMGIDI